MPVSSTSLYWTLTTRNRGWMREVWPQLPFSTDIWSDSQSSCFYIGWILKNCMLIFKKKESLTYQLYFSPLPPQTLQRTHWLTSQRMQPWSWCGKTMSVWRSTSWWVPRSSSMKRTLAPWARQPEQDTSPWSSASTSSQSQRCWHQRRHGRYRIEQIKNEWNGDGLIHSRK